MMMSLCLWKLRLVFLYIEKLVPSMAVGLTLCNSCQFAHAVDFDPFFRLSIACCGGKGMIPSCLD